RDRGATSRGFRRGFRRLRALAVATVVPRSLGLPRRRVSAQRLRGDRQSYVVVGWIRGVCRAARARTAPSVLRDDERGGPAALSLLSLRRSLCRGRIVAAPRA